MFIVAFFYRQKDQPDIYLISSNKGCFGNGTLRIGHTELTAIEGLSITFMSNGKRDFVQRDQVSALLVGYFS